MIQAREKQKSQVQTVPLAQSLETKPTDCSPDKEIFSFLKAQISSRRLLAKRRLEQKIFTETQKRRFPGI